MFTDFSIRPEFPGDAEAIGQLIDRAFADDPHSNGSEAGIVEALRNSGALTVSLVATTEDSVKSGTVVGHVAFSPVQISDGSNNWFGLGPVAVEPEFQSRGIGRALIQKGLAMLQELGAAGCVVLGEPSYYGRFGFTASQKCILNGVPPEYFQILAFGDRAAEGYVTYHHAFDASGG